MKAHLFSVFATLTLATLALSMLTPCLTLADSAFIRAGTDEDENTPFVIDNEDIGCGELLMHASGHHCGYMWQYGGVVPPDYGSFAECYSGEVEVCSAVFGLSQTGQQNGQTMDVYIWADDGGIPGPTLCVVPEVDPGPIAFHPSMSFHVIPIEGCATPESWWVGFWPDWPEQGAGWFVGEDLDGWGEGCPLTKVAPGIGYPTGWQNVSIIWGPTQDLWIGAEVVAPTPVRESTWGRIKRLYQ